MVCESPEGPRPLCVISCKVLNVPGSLATSRKMSLLSDFPLQRLG